MYKLCNTEVVKTKRLQLDPIFQDLYASSVQHQSEAMEVRGATL
jgi:hypothetical protein